MIDAAWLQGENGGMLAVAFASGAVSGFGFAQRILVKSANERISELKSEINHERDNCRKEIDLLKERVRELEEQRFELARGTN